MWSRTGKPREDVVVVEVGWLAYGSAAGSLKWYGWLASTGFARWCHRTGQTDKQETFRSGPALALVWLSRLVLCCC